MMINVTKGFQDPTIIMNPNRMRHDNLYRSHSQTIITNANLEGKYIQHIAISKQRIHMTRFAKLQEDTELKSMSNDNTSSPPMHVQDIRKQPHISSLEMTSMSFLGIAITSFILFSLTTDQFDLNFITDSSSEIKEFNLEAVEQETLMEMEVVTQRVLDSAVPDTATDVVSLVLGEGIAGSIGALANVGVALLLKLREQGKLGFQFNQQTQPFNKEQKQNSINEKKSNENIAIGNINQGRITSETFYSEAVADGDYFLTRAAVLPLLEGVGISSAAATIVSVLFATIPYEFIKLNNRRKQIQQRQKGLTEKQLKDSVASSSPAIEIDIVDVFADTTKWLEYTVLSSDFNSRLFPGNSILESAAYGFLAAFSSQVYADILYRYTEYGLKSAKESAKNRTIDDWISVYVSKCFSSATLFGVYEYARLPISRFFQAVLTGGVDSCMGSKEFDICMETFMIDNPPSEIASTEAQLRALFTAMVGLGDRVGVRFGEGFGDIFAVDNLEGNFRGLVVSFYSIISHFLPLY